MKSRIFATALAIVGLVIIDAQTANAGCKYFTNACTAGAGACSDTSAWTCDTSICTAGGSNWVSDGCSGTMTVAKPGTGDYVVICATREVNYDEGTDPSIATLEIQADAALDFDSGAAKTLTVSGADGLFLRHRQDVEGNPGLIKFTAPTGNQILVLSGGGTHVIDGVFKMNHAEATLRITTADAILAGEGSIVMSDAAAEIQVDTQMLTNRITIEGKGVIGLSGSTGTFVNDGLIHANVASGTIDLTDLTYKHGYGLFMVSTTATLKFNANIVDATELASDFLMEAGTLDIDEPLDTAGVLNYILGTLDASATAKWARAICR